MSFMPFMPSVNLQVTPGGRADKAGLLNGDNILTINGVPTTRMKHHEAQRLILLSTNSVELVW